MTQSGPAGFLRFAVPVAETPYLFGACSSIQVVMQMLFSMQKKKNTVTGRFPPPLLFMEECCEATIAVSLIFFCFQRCGRRVRIMVLLAAILGLM